MLGGLRAPRGGHAACREHCRGLQIQRNWPDDLDAIAAARRVGYPVVLKPLDGNHGRGVSVNLMTPEEVEAQWAEIKATEKAAKAARRTP